jgi:hypothetical protein
VKIALENHVAEQAQVPGARGTKPDTVSSTSSVKSAGASPLPASAVGRRQVMTADGQLVREARDHFRLSLMSIRNVIPSSVCPHAQQRRESRSRQGWLTTTGPFDASSVSVDESGSGVDCGLWKRHTATKLSRRARPSSPQYRKRRQAGNGKISPETPFRRFGALFFKRTGSFFEGRACVWLLTVDITIVAIPVLFPRSYP